MSFSEMIYVLSAPIIVSSRFHSYADSVEALDVDIAGAYEELPFTDLRAGDWYYIYVILAATGKK